MNWPLQKYTLCLLEVPCKYFQPIAWLWTNNQTRNDQDNPQKKQQTTDQSSSVALYIRPENGSSLVAKFSLMPTLAWHSAGGLPAIKTKKIASKI